MQKTYKKYFAIFALPTIIAFTIFFIVPFVEGIVLSFCKFTTVTNASWVGTANYIRAFSNDDFTNALWFTIKFTVVSMITINVLAFALAYALTRGIKGTNLFRTVFFMPNLIGGIVLGYIWQILINGILRYFDAKPSELIAFGDGMNDKEMLELAGYSYAMENAEPALRKIAKYIAPSNNDDGVLQVLDKYLNN